MKVLQPNEKPTVDQMGNYNEKIPPERWDGDGWLSWPIGMEKISLNG